MKVLLCLCAWIAAATAHGVISYPLTPIGYPGTYLTPFTTIARPVGVTYTGLQSYPLPYFSYNLIPNNLLFPGAPTFVQIVPLGPGNGKGKPDKKKPGEKGKDGNDKKEETTEEPKKDEEADSKTDATEDLAH